ncbi:serine/threonine-protein kinase [Paraliomyxa miuraensis]|uniref:serine/threonine-protein kinase n=1 Tax=Paraliomyxa miuraensis TaxID=376150 RepID=UPI00224F59DD|nr:serine/threonine-protein kinase [Paraliomyxa miuraensis]MCX4247112.1 serine/threonine-protein kinase [Paraliomyxa miuraensis]
MSYDLPTKEIPDDETAGPRAHEISGPALVAEEPETELGQGDSVGRYSVLSCLGRGGMGVVYKAYDPQLDRNVALKLLRRGRGSMKADLRLLREAKTLAKLKHPNVVAVYDAGLTHHGVFIAMELLSGQPVNEWLAERKRSVQEVLEVFRAAGRGLVAAHDAGFVHRDFKPSNVLVEDDGSVRVLDFGLAHALGEPGPDDEPFGVTFEPDQVGVEYRSPSGRVYITEAGTLVGTPAFMAPEQLLGERGDRRSEQFAFAMSLYVALYDRSPAGGETYEERRATLAKGLRIPERDLEHSAHGERVPPRIRRAILRGLADDPRARFVSMAELLAQLEKPPRRARRLAIAGFTLLTGFGVGALVFEPQPEPCSDPQAVLEGTWGPSDRSRVEDAFGTHGASVASSLPHVRERFDDYATAWVDMYEESCRATFVDRRQSELLFDRRMRCLERRRNRMRQAIDALASAESPNALTQRTILPFKLPQLDACAELDQLMAEQPLPDDEGQRQRIDGIRQRIDEADTLHDAGEFARGLELATEAVSEAREVRYLPVLGEALGSLGRLQASGASARDAQATLEEAVLVASEAGDVRGAAAAWTWLLYCATIQNRFDGATTLELAARAAVAQSGDDEVRGWLLNNLGVLYNEKGEPDVGLAYLRRALTAKVEALGPNHVDVAISWYNLGSVQVDVDAAAALDAFEHARTIFRTTVGDGHPMTLYATTGLCRVEHIRGRAEVAVELCSEVLSRFETAPTSAWWMSHVSFTLARAQWDAGMHEAARRSAERARDYLLEDNPTAAEGIASWLEDPEAHDRREREASARPGAAP